MNALGYYASYAGDRNGNGPLVGTKLIYTKHPNPVLKHTRGVLF